MKARKIAPNLLAQQLKQKDNTPGPPKQIAERPSEGVMEQQAEAVEERDGFQTPHDSRATDALQDAEIDPMESWQWVGLPMPETGADTEGKSVVVDWNGATVNAGSLQVQGNRLGFNVQGTGANENGNSLQGAVQHQQVQMTVQHEFKAPGTPTANAFLGVFEGELALGGGGTFKTEGGTSGSATVFAMADRTVKHIGRYEGEDPTLLGMHQVEISRSAGGEGYFGVQKLASLIGVGGLLTPMVGKATTYRTHVPPEDAAKVFNDHRGVAGYLRNKARALDVMDETLEIPRLDQPEKLKNGDELTVHTKGSIAVGLALGSFGAMAGIQGVIRGDFELRAQKLSENQIELTVTPTDVKAFDCFAGLPLAGDIGLQLAKATGTRRSFVFDLSKPEAKAAYLEALQGRLPGGNTTRGTGGEQFVKQVRDSEPQLPEGVTRKFAETSTAKRKQFGFGINFGLVLKEGPIGGLGSYWVRSSGTREMTDGKTLARVDTRDVERRKEFFLSGTESVGVRAAKRTITTFDDQGKGTSKFGGVTVLVRFADDKVRGLELNKDVIGPLKQVLGLELQPISRKRKNEDWEIQVARTLNEAELKRLAKPADGDMGNAAQKSGLDVVVVMKLVDDVAATKDPGERADVVLQFICQNGLEGFSALHQLLGGARMSLAVDRATNAYDRELERAERLSLRYPNRLAPEEKVSAVKSRFKEAQKVLAGIDRALDNLAEDPFAEKGEAKELEQKLQMARARVEGVMMIEHLTPDQRRAWHDRLVSGWVTGLEEALAQHLAKAGLI